MVLAEGKRGPQVEGDGCDRTEDTERVKSSMKMYGIQREGRKDILSHTFFSIRHLPTPKVFSSLLVW